MLFAGAGLSPKNVLPDVLPDAAERLLRDAEVRSDVGQRHARQQRGETVHEAAVAGGGIFRHEGAAPVYGFQQAFLVDLGYDLVPAHDGIVQLIPAFLGEHEESAIGNGLYVFGGGHSGIKLLVVYHKAVFLHEVVGDLLALVVVVAKAEHALQHKAGIAGYFARLGEVILFFQLHLFGLAGDEVYLLLIEMAELEDVIDQRLHLGKVGRMAGCGFTIW